MSMTISYQQAAQLSLDRIDQQLKTMAESEKERPRYVIGFQTYSILDLKSQIERNTQVGRTWVMNEAQRLGYIVT